MDRVSNAFVKSAQAQQPVGMDKRGGASGLSRVKIAITGTAPGAHTYDQAAIFANETDAVISTDYALATVTPGESRFNTAALLGNYFSHNPAEVKNLNITGADAAATISSLEAHVVRFEPSGSQAQHKYYASEFQTASDQIQTRVQIPLSEVVDGYTYLRLINDANATPASYTLTATLNAQSQARMQAPISGPAVVVSSAGR